MAYTVTKAKDDLDGILKGTTTNKVTNIFAVFRRAAFKVLEDVDPQETKRKASLASALFDQVYDYAAPDDLKGERIIDIRPQVNRSRADNFSKTTSAQFDLNKMRENNLIHVAFNQGTKFLRIQKDIGGLVKLNECDSLTTNGTWAGGDDTTNLVADTSNYLSASGSLRFDVTGATTTASLVNSTMTAIDLSEHEDESSLFLWVYLPDASTITSVSLTWGSGASAHWARTVTTPHFGSFINGWNLVRFDWNGATETGSPVASAVNYLKVAIAYDGVADTDFRIDSIVSNNGEIFDIEYYSKYLFRDGSTGIWKEEPSADSDIVNLDTDSYNLWLFKVAEYCMQQVEATKDDTIYFANEYARSLRRYKSKYKGETMKTQTRWYRVRNNNQPYRRIS